ncbi:MAG: DUF6377 domain-containing protein [Bacteroidales bacterium]|nr:DUF6377 domain-containing protein [Bacteroidales bacterium]
MLRLRIIILLTALLCSTASLSQSTQSLDSLTLSLENIVNEKQRQIDIITSSVGYGETYDIAYHLYDEYKSFKCDSAVKYAIKMIDLATQSGNQMQLAGARLCYAQILSVCGHFAKANEIIAAIDTSGMGKSFIIKYLKAKSDLCLYNSEFAEHTNLYKSYHDSSLYYHNKIIEIADKNSMDYVFSSAIITSETDGFAKAIELLEQYVNSITIHDRNYSILASTLGFFYKSIHNNEEAERYYRLSAACDLRNAIMENNSLRCLAVICMEHGDIDHAFEYVTMSGACATFYGSRLRLSQNSQIAPQIISQYKAQRDEISRKTLVMLILIIIVAIVLAILIFVIFKERNKLKKANMEIMAKNKELSTLLEKINASNNNLQESNNIREEYIGRFLELCNLILESIENRMLTLNKLAREKKMEDLYKNLKNERHVAELKDLFYKNFDTAFLNIYPNFEQEINAQLKPEYAITIENGQLTTELRIVALVRIGIADNKKIASILRSSIATIYTYRSKFKAKLK